MSRVDEDPAACIRRLEAAARARCEAAARRAQDRVLDKVDALVPHDELAEWVRARPRTSLLLAASGGFFFFPTSLLRKAASRMHVGVLLGWLAGVLRTQVYSQMRAVLRGAYAPNTTNGDRSTHAGP